MVSPKAPGKFIGAISLSYLGGLGLGATLGKCYTIEEAVKLAFNMGLEVTIAPTPGPSLSVSANSQPGISGGPARGLNSWPWTLSISHQTSLHSRTRRSPSTS